MGVPAAKRRQVKAWYGSAGVRDRKRNKSRRDGAVLPVARTRSAAHPFKCGNNSLNAADEDDRINS